MKTSYGCGCLVASLAGQALKNVIDMAPELDAKVGEPTQVFENDRQLFGRSPY